MRVSLCEKKEASKQRRRRKPEKTTREQTTPTELTKGQKRKKIFTTLEKSCKYLAKIAALQLACISPFLLGKVSLAIFSSFFSTVAAAAATYHRYDSRCWWWWWYTAKGQICSVLLMMTPETTATACSPVDCCRWANLRSTHLNWGRKREVLSACLACLPRTVAADLAATSSAATACRLSVAVMVKLPMHIHLPNAEHSASLIALSGQMYDRITSSVGQLKRRCNDAESVLHNANSDCKQSDRQTDRQTDRLGQLALEKSKKVEYRNFILYL